MERRVREGGKDSECKKREACGKGILVIEQEKTKKKGDCWHMIELALLEAMRRFIRSLSVETTADISSSKGV